MSRDEVATLQAFIKRLLPSFPIGRKGASAKKIQKLEKRIGDRLPEAYRWFLEKMGEETRPLWLGWPVFRPDFAIDSVMAWNGGGDLLTIGNAGREGEATYCKLKGDLDERLH